MLATAAGSTAHGWEIPAIVSSNYAPWRIS